MKAERDPDDVVHGTIIGFISFSFSDMTSCIRDRRIFRLLELPNAGTRSDPYAAGI